MATRIHPTAIIEPGAALGADVEIGAYAYVSAQAVIGDGKIGPVTQKLYDTMTGMQWGKLPDTKGWIVPVEKQF